MKLYEIILIHCTNNVLITILKCIYILYNVSGFSVQTLRIISI